VKYYRETGEFLLDGLQHVKCEGRRYEFAGLGITGALLGLEFVCAVAGSDGDCKRIALGLLDKINHVFGPGVMGSLGRDFILNTCQHTEFSLDGDIVLVCVVDYLAGQGDVLVIRESGTVDHDRREAEIDTALAELIAVAMIKVKNDLRALPTKFLGIFNSSLGHVAKEGLVRIIAGTLAHLEDNGRLCLCSGLDNGLKLLHVVEVECRNGVTALDGLGKHLACVHKAKIFKRNFHNVLMNY
jgi:hypothetical protein